MLRAFERHFFVLAAATDADRTDHLAAGNDRKAAGGRENAIACQLSCCVMLLAILLAAGEWSGGSATAAGTDAAREVMANAWPPQTI